MATATQDGSTVALDRPKGAGPAGAPAYIPGIKNIRSREAGSVNPLVTRTPSAAPKGLSFEAIAVLIILIMVAMLRAVIPKRYRRGFRCSRSCQRAIMAIHSSLIPVPVVIACG